MNPVNMTPGLAAAPGPFPGLGAHASSGPRLALDNLIRRELKVGDPNDAAQVAQALMARYRDDPRARAIAQEAQGLPVLPPSGAAPVLQGGGATSLDLLQAGDDIESDLRELTTSNLAKDIVPELEGWAQAIRSTFEQGVAAARAGTDTRSRDKAFAMRRQLGEYARLSRLIGVLTPALNPSFRDLAQSLDEGASVILVMLGEALANTGFSGGRYLLQVPFSELQARRDGVLNALRMLTGATQEAFGPNDWPRGIDAYRQLFAMLEARGHGELRSLLDEGELARSMDEMVQTAGSGGPAALRALGATAFSQLNRFTRFVQLTIDAVTPASPPLAAFLEAMQTFIDGFDSAGGFRLLRIARPAILFYGLYGAETMGPADRRLLHLVANRGAIAGKLDCLTRCTCDAPAVQAQIIGDRALHDIDRAIDLYCIGDRDLGLPEVRAAAYSYVVQAVAQFIGSQAGKIAMPERLVDLLNETVAILRPVGDHAQWDDWSAREYQRNLDDPKARDWNASLLVQELSLQQTADEQLRTIVEQMTTNCLSSSDVFTTCLGGLSEEAIGLITRANWATYARMPLNIPNNYETSLDKMAGRNGAGNPSGLAPEIELLRKQNEELLQKYGVLLEEMRRWVERDRPHHPNGPAAPGTDASDAGGRQ